eukprot:14567068-Alexandrium_andersonii.AAC.1
MSASLVGSEMCIRDSPRAQPWANAQGNPPAPRTVRACVSCVVLHRLLRCLLYTSDAADDM